MIAVVAERAWPLKTGAIARGELWSAIRMLRRLAEVGGHVGSLHVRLVSAMVVEVEMHGLKAAGEDDSALPGPAWAKRKRRKESFRGVGRHKYRLRRQSDCR